MRRKNNNVMLNSNIATGFYATEFSVKDSVRETEKYILSRKYGEVVTNDNLSAMLGYDLNVEKQKSKYKRVMAKIRNRLINDHYILRSVNGIGYYILRPEDVAGHCYRTYIKRSMNLIDKSDNLLVNTDKDELTGDKLAEFNEIVELNNKIAEQLWDNVKESRYYNRIEHAAKIMEGNK